MDPGSLASGPGLTPHGTAVERVGNLTGTLPSPLIVHSFSLKLVFSKLLLQLKPRAHRTEVSLKAQDLLLDLKELLCCVPWVQVTEERQKANCLLQPTAVYQVVQCVVEELYPDLVPRCLLWEADLFSSLILRQHLLHLVALFTARLLPDEESADQERQNQVEAAAVPPLPPQFTISSELVEVLLLQLVLTLPPVDTSGGQPLSPQDLLVLLLRMTAVTLRTLNNTPGVAVDTNAPLPVCDTRQPVLQLQSSLLSRFGSATQGLLKHPALRATVQHSIAEVALTIYRSLRQAFPPGTSFPCVTAPREEDSAEMSLFLRPLPGVLRERLCRHYGEWVGNSKLFRRAFAATSVEDSEGHDVRPPLEKPLVPDPGPVAAAVERAVEKLRSRSQQGFYDVGPRLPLPANRLPARGSSSTGSAENPARLPGKQVTWRIPIESIETVSARAMESSSFRGLCCCCMGKRNV